MSGNRSSQETGRVSRRNVTIRAAVILPAPEPFDATWLEGFLGVRAISGLEAFVEGEYVRSLRGRNAVLGVRFPTSEGAPREIQVRTAGDLSRRDLAPLLTRLFDLDAPLEELEALAARDAKLRKIVSRRRGLRLPVYDDPWEAFARAILGQQVSVAAARTIGGRLVARFGAPASRLSGLPADLDLRFFPEPSAVAAAGGEGLRSLGLTGAKAATLARAAAAVADGEIDFAALRQGEPEVAIRALCALPGIGPWTASYVALRGLGCRDAFPAGDLGVRKALAGNDGKLPSEREVLARAESWRPWRGYAVLHLWESLG